MSFLQKVKNWFKTPEPPILREQVDTTEQSARSMEITVDTDRLSKNFRLSEFTKSQTASRKKISNTPTPEHLENIKVLVAELLQPLRNELDMPIIITSGYRSTELNRIIGGASNSQHCKGEAVDIECIGMNNLELAEYIVRNYDFDQLILEFYNPSEGPYSGWVHVSYKKSGNRKEVLSALTDGKNTRYVRGIYRP